MLLATDHDAGEISICVPTGSASKRGEDLESTDAVGFGPGAKLSLSFVAAVTEAGSGSVVSRSKEGRLGESIRASAVTARLRARTSSTYWCGRVRPSPHGSRVRYSAKQIRRQSQSYELILTWRICIGRASKNS